MPGHWTATLPPPSSRYTAEQLAKFEEYQKRQSKAHPLYSTSASEIGKVPRGVTVQLRPPEHGLKRAAHVRAVHACLGGPSAQFHVASARSMRDGSFGCSAPRGAHAPPRCCLAAASHGAARRVCAAAPGQRPDDEHHKAQVPEGAGPHVRRGLQCAGTRLERFNYAAHLSRAGCCTGTGATSASPHTGQSNCASDLSAPAMQK